MTYVTHTVSRIVGADADEVSEHYAKTLSPAKVEPLQRNAQISVEDGHYSMGRYGIWKGSCHSGMKVSLSSPPDVHVLYLPLLGAMNVDIGQRRLVSTPGTASLGDMARFENMTFNEGRSHIGIAFEKLAMIQQLRDLFDEPITRNIEFADTIDVTMGKGLQIAALGNLIWDCVDVSDTDRFLQAGIERLFEAMMLMLLETVPNNYLARLTKPISPALPKQLKRAIEYMYANISSPISVIDIAREAGTSVRTLQATFQQFKETTPLSFLRIIRLEGARKTLADNTNALSVAEIARSWGFPHMGRFAVMYRDSFGETPSETARMRSGRSKSRAKHI